MLRLANNKEGLSTELFPVMKWCPIQA